jgi:hypothetical protein
MLNGISNQKIHTVSGDMAKKARQESNLNLQETKAVSATAPATLNDYTVDAFVCVLNKGERDIVDSFKAALDARKTAAMDTIKANHENDIVDSKGLPKGSAPNDLYNTVSELERAFHIAQPNDERVSIAATTIRAIIAAVCSEIQSYKNSLGGKTTGRVKNTGTSDQSYL